MSTYDFKYAITMLKQAIDFAQAEGDFAPARKWSLAVEAAGNELELSNSELMEGMRLMVEYQPEEIDSEILRDNNWLDTGIEVRSNSALLGGVRPVQLKRTDIQAFTAADYDQTPFPSDMPVIDMDTVKEVKF